jgi:hypothetical protein
VTLKAAFSRVQAAALEEVKKRGHRDVYQHADAENIFSN